MENNLPASQTLPAVNPPRSNLSSNRLLILVIIIMTLIIIGSLFSIIYLFFPQVVSRLPNNGSYTFLPVNSNDPAIVQFKSMYHFRGKVLDIKTVDNKPLLVTNITAKGIPLFVIEPNTNIHYRTKENQLIRTEFNKLRKNHIVTLTSIYNHRSKTWNTSDLVIEDPTIINDDI